MIVRVAEDDHPWTKPWNFLAVLRGVATSRQMQAIAPPLRLIRYRRIGARRK